MKTLTLDQVRKAGRFAEHEFWRATFGPDGRCEITNRATIKFPPAKDNFDSSEEWLATQVIPVPVHGWHHLPGCGCEFCK